MNTGMGVIHWDTFLKKIDSPSLCSPSWEEYLGSPSPLRLLLLTGLNREMVLGNL